MAQYSDRLSLILPDLDDPYDIGIYNNLVELLDRSMVVGTGVGAVEKLTEAEYAALPTHSPTTLYAITGASSFRLMLGELPLEAGGGASVTSNVFRVEDNALIGEVTSDLSYGYGSWSYNSGADEILTTASVSISASTKPGTLAVCCMHRDTVTISGDGWTKLVDSVPALYSGINQYITVWTKSRAGSREAETITITQASSIRMAVRVFDFYGTNVSLSVAGNELISSFPYTPVANTGKRRLYLTSSIYAGGSQCITLQSGFARTYANVRFCTFVDYMAGASDTPTFAYYSSYDANSANCLTLDITINGE